MTSFAAGWGDRMGSAVGQYYRLCSEAAQNNIFWLPGILIQRSCSTVGQECWPSSLPRWATDVLCSGWASVAMVPAGAELDAMLSTWAVPVCSSTWADTVCGNVNCCKCYSKGSGGSPKIKNKTII